MSREGWNVGQYFFHKDRKVCGLLDNIVGARQYQIWPGKEYSPATVTFDEENLIADRQSGILNVLAKAFEYEASTSSSNKAKLAAADPKAKLRMGMTKILLDAHGRN